MKIFAERLLELRTECKLSQAELGKILKVSSSIISYWETDKSEPSAYNLVKIATFFNVSIDYLLGRTDY